MCREATLAAAMCHRDGSTTDHGSMKLGITMVCFFPPGFDPMHIGPETCPGLFFFSVVLQDMYYSFVQKVWICTVFTKPKIWWNVGIFYKLLNLDVRVLKCHFFCG